MTELLIVDACVLINLVASEILADIGQANGVEFGVARPAANESLFIYLPTEHGIEKTTIDIRGLEAAGQIRLLDFQAAELQTFVEMAGNIGDGEAATLAIAVHRRQRMATDDRRALRFIEEQQLQLAADRTSSLLRRWANVSKATKPAVAEILLRIRNRASFEPNRSDPNHDWWIAAIRG